MTVRSLKDELYQSSNLDPDHIRIKFGTKTLPDDYPVIRLPNFAHLSVIRSLPLVRNPSIRETESTFYSVQYQIGNGKPKTYSLAEQNDWRKMATIKKNQGYSKIHNPSTSDSENTNNTTQIHSNQRCSNEPRWFKEIMRRRETEGSQDPELLNEAFLSLMRSTASHRFSIERSLETDSGELLGLNDTPQLDSRHDEREPSPERRWSTRRVRLTDTTRNSRHMNSQTFIQQRISQNIESPQILTPGWFSQIESAGSSMTPTTADILFQNPHGCSNLSNREIPSPSNLMRAPVRNATTIIAQNYTTNPQGVASTHSTPSRQYVRPGFDTSTPTNVRTSGPVYQTPTRSYTGLGLPAMRTQSIVSSNDSIRAMRGDESPRSVNEQRQQQATINYQIREAQRRNDSHRHQQYSQEAIRDDPPSYTRYPTVHFNVPIAQQLLMPVYHPQVYPAVRSTLTPTFNSQEASSLGISQQREDVMANLAPHVMSLQGRTLDGSNFRSLSLENSAESTLRQLSIQQPSSVNNFEEMPIPMRFKLQVQMANSNQGQGQVSDGRQGQMETNFQSSAENELQASVAYQDQIAIANELRSMLNGEPYPMINRSGGSLANDNDYRMQAGGFQVLGTNGASDNSTTNVDNIQLPTGFQVPVSSRTPVSIGNVDLYQFSTGIQGSSSRGTPVSIVDSSQFHMSSNRNNEQQSSSRIQQAEIEIRGMTQSSNGTRLMMANEPPSQVFNTTQISNGVHLLLSNENHNQVSNRIQVPMANWDILCQMMRPLQYQEANESQFQNPIMTETRASVPAQATPNGFRIQMPNGGHYQVSDGTQYQMPNLSSDPVQVTPIQDPAILYQTPAMRPPQFANIIPHHVPRQPSTIGNVQHNALAMVQRGWFNVNALPFFPRSNDSGDCDSSRRI